MRTDEDRLSHARQFAQHRPEFDPRPRVEPGCRLIQKQNRWIVNQRLCQAEPLLGPLAESADLCVRQRRQIGQVQDALDDGRPLPARDAPRSREETQVLARGQAVVHAVLVGHVPDELAHSIRFVENAAPADPCLASRRVDQRSQHANGCGLAGPVRPDEAEHLARRHVEADSVDGLDSVVVLG